MRAWISSCAEERVAGGRLRNAGGRHVVPNACICEPKRAAASLARMCHPGLPCVRRRAQCIGVTIPRGAFLKTIEAFDFSARGIDMPECTEWLGHTRDPRAQSVGRNHARRDRGHPFARNRSHRGRIDLPSRSKSVTHTRYRRTAVPEGDRAYWVIPYPQCPNAIGHIG